MSLSLAEPISKIDALNVATPEKEAAKSRLAAFLSHPFVAAIIGGWLARLGANRRRRPNAASASDLR